MKIDKRNRPPEDGEIHYFEADEPVPHWLEKIIPQWGMLLIFGVAVRVKNENGTMVVQPLSIIPDGKFIMKSAGQTCEDLSIIGAPTIIKTNPMGGE